MAKAKPIVTPEPDPTILDVCDRCNSVHVGCTGHRSRKDKDGNLIACKQKITTSSKSKKCRAHGGTSPSGIAHYRYNGHARPPTQTKLSYLPSPEMVERANALAGDVIANLEESIKIGALIETQYLEKLNTGESSKAWIELDKAVDDYEKAGEAIDMIQAFATIRRIVKDGVYQTHLIRDIQAAQESQRKITETAVKARKDRSETFTAETFNWLLAKLIHVLRSEVEDRRTLAKIQTALEREYESVAEHTKNPN